MSPGIRNMTAADQPMVRLQAESFAAHLYPELIPDVGREAAMLTQARAQQGWYARVIGPEGSPTAALLAQTGDNTWATKKHSTIVLWYSTKAPQGAVLVRDFQRWVRADKRIVLAAWLYEAGCRDAAAVLERLGFKPRGGARMWFPEGRA